MKLIACLAVGILTSAHATEFHVSAKGADSGDGSAAKPFKTISAAAKVAQPGDTITVHAGVYRERVTPPRGGESDTKRIVYQAAPGEKPEIKGSEVVKDWQKFGEGVWKTVLPNSFFGGYNPYADKIRGDWFDARGRDHHTGAVYLDGEALDEAAKLDDLTKAAAGTRLWFGQVDQDQTTLWARFGDADPNRGLVEINVRRAVFYPEQPGINYLTVRGFTMRHAATQWAPPTAEQVGLIGTHWSKGWIIENNVISHSRCSGVTLGKYGDQWDNTSADTAEGYVKTIERAHARGWNKDTVGSHIVRDNTISHCEQTGICGSLGAIFSTITRNHIHHIWSRRLFAGAEMGGIKLHAAIDVVISDNHIHHSGRGVWMDWMAQGTRITRNLCHDNTTDDLFVEVNHGPFLVDNNLFLSPIGLVDMSEGGAFAHNLLTGRIVTHPEPNRETPWHPAHSTKVAGLATIKGGDNRFYNNLFCGGGLEPYEERERPLFTGGNVYLNGSKPGAKDPAPALVSDADPAIRLAEENNSWHLQWTPVPELATAKTSLVTTDLLGKAAVSGVGYDNPDGSPLAVDTDFFGAKRDPKQPVPGPFARPGAGKQTLKVR